MMRSVLAVMVCVAISASAMAADFPLTGTNTKVEFTGTKKDGKHDGGFKKVTGTAKVSGTDMTTLEIEVDIETESLYSDDNKLTGHLKSPDFFAVKQHPKATFKSKKVEASGKTYNITGELTLLGKTKEVTFPASVKAENKSLTVKSEKFKIKRSEFGMTYGAGKVDDEVSITVSFEAEQK